MASIILPLVPAMSAVSASETFVHELEARRRMQAWDDHVAVAGSHRFGTRRRVEEPQKQSYVGRNRLRIPVDLRRPAMPLSRPTNMFGATSFHWSLTSINNVGASDSDPGALAVQQENYVSGGIIQDPAKPVGQERYVNAAAQAADGVEQALSATRVDYIKSNISPSLSGRLEFWKEVNRNARKTGSPVLELHPRLGTTADWERVVNATEMPLIVRETARDIVASMQRGRPASAWEKPIELLLLDPADQIWAKANNRAQGRKRKDRILHFRVPRAALLQQRLEAELPYELDEAGRCAVVDAVAADLDRLGVRYTIVIHHPEARNDRRNYHIHILIFPGECQQRADGSWDFHSKRKLRPGDIQRVLADMPLDPKGNYHNVLATADVTALRTRFAAHCNTALAKSEVTRRFDPRSYSVMGIDQEPGEHLGGARSSDVAAGLSDEIDMANVKKAWSGERGRMEQRHAQNRCAINAEIHRMDREIANAVPPFSAWLKVLRDDVAAAKDEAYETMVEIDSLDLEDRITRSGAERLERNMLAWIAQAKSSKATPAKQRDLPLVEARLEYARRHLAEIDRAREPWADVASERIVRRQAAEARAKAAWKAFMDVLAEAEQATREADLAAAAPTVEVPVPMAVPQVDPWTSTTVLPAADYPVRLDPFGHFNALVAYIQGANPAMPIERYQAGYRVVGLKAADRELLQRPRFAARAQLAFAPMYEHQQKDIGRLLAFARQHGELCLSTGLQRNPPRQSIAIANLYARYHRHPSFLAQIDAAEAAYEAMRDAERLATAKPDAPAQAPAPMPALTPANLPTVPPAPTIVSQPVKPAPMPETMARGPEPMITIPVRPSKSPALDATELFEPAAMPMPVPVTPAPVIQPVDRRAEDNVLPVRVESGRSGDEEPAAPSPLVEQSHEPAQLSPFAGLSIEEAAARKLASQRNMAEIRAAARGLAAKAEADRAKAPSPTLHKKPVDAAPAPRKDVNPLALTPVPSPAKSVTPPSGTTSRTRSEHSGASSRRRAHQGQVWPSSSR
jgi:hypothetical protein